MNRKHRTLWISLAILFMLIGLASWALWPKPVFVSTKQITPTEFQEYIEEEGKTRPKELFVIDSPVVGTLVRPQTKSGDFIQKDAVLATILPSSSSPLDPQSGRERQNSLEKARLQLEQAERDYKRGKLLLGQGVIPQSEYEQFELQYNVARREFETARFALKAAQTKPNTKNSIVLRAPISGQIMRVFGESGGPVSIGAPIMEMADISNLEVVVDILSSEAPRVKENAKVILKRWGGDQDLNGLVRQIEPGAFTKVSALGVEEQRVNVIIDITSKPELWKEKLGSGYRADTQILTHEASNAITAPLSSLFRETDGWAVFVVENGKAHKRRISFAHKNNQVALIDSGLKDGDVVIEYPSENIKEGTRVRSKPSNL